MHLAQEKVRAESLLTSLQAANYLNLTRERFNQLVKAGEIRVAWRITPRSRKYYKQTDLEQFRYKKNLQQTAKQTKEADLLTPAQAARYLGLSHPIFFREVKAGRIKAAQDMAYQERLIAEACSGIASRS